MKITDIKAIQILDSRGNPTIKAFVRAGDSWGEFSVPSGASTGVHEALELRDGGDKFGGLGVEKAIKNILGPIKNTVLGIDVTDQRGLDEALIRADGTENKSGLGANAILAVSGAATRAAANALNIPLYSYLRVIFENNGIWQSDFAISNKDYVMPDLYFNIVNGGKHAENNIDIQESMIVPHATTVAEKVRIASEVYGSLRSLLKGMNLQTGLGDEGGFAPSLDSNSKTIELIVEAIEKAGYKPEDDVSVALDIAASEIYEDSKDKKYVLASENVALSSIQLVSWYKELILKYPIISIEDGLAQDDWDGWKLMTERIGEKVQLVGDDLFVTNVSRIQEGIDHKVANAVLIKINQVGTITETFDAINLAKQNGYKSMISHRSGETADSFIADLVVATSVAQIKAGAPARGERTAKYNRLIEIESELARN